MNAKKKKDWTVPREDVKSLHSFLHNCSTNFLDDSKPTSDSKFGENNTEHIKSAELIELLGDLEVQMKKLIKVDEEDSIKNNNSGNEKRLEQKIAQCMKQNPKLALLKLLCPNLLKSLASLKKKIEERNMEAMFTPSKEKMLKGIETLQDCIIILTSSQSPSKTINYMFKEKSDFHIKMRFLPIVSNFEEPRVFCDEVLIVLSNALKQQRMPILFTNDKLRELQREWAPGNVLHNVTTTVSNFYRIVEEFGLDSAYIFMVPDMHSHDNELRHREHGLVVPYTVDNDLEKIMFPFQAIYTLFRMYCCGVNWDFEDCGERSTSRKEYREAILGTMLRFAEEDPMTAQPMFVLCHATQQLRNHRFYEKPEPTDGIDFIFVKMKPKETVNAELCQKMCNEFKVMPSYSFIGEVEVWKMRVLFLYLTMDFFGNDPAYIVLKKAIVQCWKYIIPPEEFERLMNEEHGGPPGFLREWGGQHLNSLCREIGEIRESISPDSSSDLLASFGFVKLVKFLGIAVDSKERTERRRIILRSFPMRKYGANNTSLFCEEVVDMVKDVLKAQGIILDEEKEKYLETHKINQWSANPDIRTTIEIDYVSKLFDALGIDQREIYHRNDDDYERALNNAPSNFSDPVCIASNEGEMMMSLIEAMLYVFQSVVCGYNWNKVTGTNCFIHFKKKVLSVVGSYSGYDYEELIFKSSVDKYIENLKEHPIFKKVSLPYSDYLWNNDGINDLIFLKMYVDRREAFGLPIHDGIQLKKTPAWRARFELLVEWIADFQDDYPVPYLRAMNHGLLQRIPEDVKEGKKYFEDYFYTSLNKKWEPRVILPTVTMITDEQYQSFIRSQDNSEKRSEVQQDSGKPENIAIDVEKQNLINELISLRRKCFSSSLHTALANEAKEEAVKRADKYEKKAKKTEEMEKEVKNMRTTMEKMEKTENKSQMRINEMEQNVQKYEKQLIGLKELKVENKDLKKQVKGLEMKKTEIENKNKELSMKVEDQEKTIETLFLQMLTNVTPTNELSKSSTESELSTSSSSSSDSNIPHWKTELEELQKKVKAFSKDQVMSNALTLLESYANVVTIHITEGLAEYEMLRLEALMRLYLDTIQLNILKIQRTHDSSNLLPLPEFPSLSEEFKKEYREMMHDDNKIDCYFCFLELGGEIYKCPVCRSQSHMTCWIKWLSQPIANGCSICRDFEKKMSGVE